MKDFVILLSAVIFDLVSEPEKPYDLNLIICFYNKDLGTLYANWLGIAVKPQFVIIALICNNACSNL